MVKEGVWVKELRSTLNKVDTRIWAAFELLLLLFMSENETLLVRPHEVLLCTSCMVGRMVDTLVGMVTP